MGGYDKYGRKVIIDISSRIDIDIASLEARQIVAMMTMDLGFCNPDEQVNKWTLSYKLGFLWGLK